MGWWWWLLLALCLWWAFLWWWCQSSKSLHGRHAKPARSLIKYNALGFMRRMWFWWFGQVMTQSNGWFSDSYGLRFLEHIVHIREVSTWDSAEPEWKFFSPHNISLLVSEGRAELEKLLFPLLELRILVASVILVTFSIGLIFSYSTHFLTSFWLHIKWDVTVLFPRKFLSVGTNNRLEAMNGRPKMTIVVLCL